MKPGKLTTIPSYDTVKTNAPFSADNGETGGKTFVAPTDHGVEGRENFKLRVQAQKPNRPALRWHGGKWLLAPWIISHFPPHRVYVEPFGGAMSVLIRKSRSYAEVYNDLDADAVNLFRVLRTSRSQDLIDALRLTPFARAEFDEAYTPTDCPVEQARRLIIRSFMGFGSDGHNRARTTGFRDSSNRSGTTPAHDWTNYPDALERIVDRLAGVVIENRDALQVMTATDTPETLHYVDPPYVWTTRSTTHSSSKKPYTHEMTDVDHVKLLDFLRGLSGMVVLSGYRHPLYDDALSDWRRVEKASLTDGARKRVEVIWLNAAAGRHSADMFTGLAA